WWGTTPLAQRPGTTPPEPAAALALLGEVRTAAARRSGAGQRGQHLPDVGQLGVDRVAALDVRGELALGLVPDPLGAGHRLGAGRPRFRPGPGLRRGGPALSGGGDLVGLGAGALPPIAPLVQRVLRLVGALLEDSLGLVPPLGERLLEVGGGLGRAR